MPDQESPCAQRLEGAVVRGHRAPGEAERRSEESAALVEHALLDDLVRLPEHRRRNLEPRVFAVLRLITSSNSRGTTRKAGATLYVTGIEHSLTSATDAGWQSTPWRARRRGHR